MPRDRLEGFLCDEDGAVTLDWVVLTAAILTFGAVVVSYITTGSSGMSASMGASLASAQVPTIEFTKVD